MTAITRIEGLGAADADRLRRAGIRTAERLLAAGGTRQGRAAIAADCTVGEAQVLEWVNRADLMRVRGIGPGYSELLEQAGVDTVKELATRRPDHLHAACLEVSATKGVIRRVPSAGDVERWVAHAKTLPAAVTH